MAAPTSPTSAPAVLPGLLAEVRPVAAHRPWPRVEVEAELWAALAQRLAEGALSLLGLWGDGDRVHMALIDAAGSIGVATIRCRDGRFPSVGR
ncbi:MAG: hydrogenase expression protein HypE, partial [Rhodospirillaceae bacterium]|nr:hydrogenase expression protein HypE [Rhodospirillaceae bacterium]